MPLPNTAYERFVASRASPALAFVAIIAAAAHGLWSGWGRWGDFIIDTGRELEWPRRIAGGEQLYVDLRYFYGPLAPELNALLYRLFGVHVWVLAAAGAMTAVVTAFVLYAITRRFVGRWPSTVAAVCFLYVCAFAHIQALGIFNWVLPYSFSTVYGMAAALFSLLFLLRHSQTSDVRDLVLSLAFLGVAATSKLEPLVPALAAHATFVIAATWTRTLRMVHGVAWAVWGVVVTAFWAAIHARVGVALWRDHVGGGFNSGSRAYVRLMMGLGDVQGNTLDAGVSAAMIAGFLGVGILAGALSSREQERVPLKIAVVAAAAALVGGVAFAAGPEHPLLAVPLLVYASIPYLLVRWVRRPERRTALLPAIILSVFTAAALPRIILRASPVHYGFYLLAPAFAWLAVLLFGAAESRSTRWKRVALAVTVTALLAGNAAAAHRASVVQFERKTLALRSPRGTMWIWPEWRNLAPILDAIARSPRDATLAYIPHHSALQFLFERRRPADGQPGYLPMDLFGGFDEPSMIAKWQRDPPDLVLLDRRPMTEFGFEEFGVTYGVSFWHWIKRRYVVVTNPEWPFVLMRRMDGAT